MGPAVPGELPGTHEVRNVAISGNPWISVNYRAAPLTAIAMPGPQGRVAGILEIREIAE